MCVCMYLWTKGMREETRYITTNKMARLVSASVLSPETACDLLHMLIGIVTYIR